VHLLVCDNKWILLLKEYKILSESQTKSVCVKVMFHTKSASKREDLRYAMERETLWIVLKEVEPCASILYSVLSRAVTVFILLVYSAFARNFYSLALEVERRKM
jgi:hypothetical protein